MTWETLRLARTGLWLLFLFQWGEHWIPLKKLSQGSVVEELMAAATGTLSHKMMRGEPQPQALKTLSHLMHL